MTSTNKISVTTGPVKPEAVTTRQFDAPWKREIDDVFERLAKLLEKTQDPEFQLKFDGTLRVMGTT